MQKYVCSDCIFVEDCHLRLISADVNDKASFGQTNNYEKGNIKMVINGVRKGNKLKNEHNGRPRVIFDMFLFKSAIILIQIFSIITQKPAFYSSIANSVSYALNRLNHSAWSSLLEFFK